MVNFLITQPILASIVAIVMVLASAVGYVLLPAAQFPEIAPWEPSVVSAHIGVTATSGVVTLTGHVESYAQKHAAEAPARRVKSVKAVAEEVEVRLPFETKRTEEDIATAEIDRVGWNVSIPKNAVKVQVANGWVTLTGQVDWDYQKNAAGQELRHLSGITEVSDQITVKPRVDVADIGDSITHALHRPWFFDPQTVMVSANGGQVRFHRLRPSAARPAARRRDGLVRARRDRRAERHRRHLSFTPLRSRLGPPPSRATGRASTSGSAHPGAAHQQGTSPMSQHDASMAVYGKHDAVETAVRKIIEEGLDREHLSIVGRDRQAGETTIASSAASISHPAGSGA